MSEIDEIRKRHEAILFIDWDKEFDPEAQPLSNSNARQCHADRAYLLEHITELEADKDWWENTCNEWRESCQKAQRERDSAIISSDMWWRETGKLNALLDEIAKVYWKVQGDTVPDNNYAEGVRYVLNLLAPILKQREQTG